MCLGVEYYKAVQTNFKYLHFLKHTLEVLATTVTITLTTAMAAKTTKKIASKCSLFCKA